MKDITTFAGITSYINGLSKKAIDILTIKIKDKLVENIQKNIYDSYDPHEYQRTFDFRDKAWVQEKARQTASYVVGQVKYDPKKMTYNGALYQHGNIYKDRRFDLARILNSGITSNSDWDFGRPSAPETIWSSQSFTKTGHFFDDTIKWLLKNFNKLVVEAYASVGLSITINTNKKQESEIDSLSDIDLDSIFDDI